MLLTKTVIRTCIHHFNQAQKQAQLFLVEIHQLYHSANVGQNGREHALSSCVQQNLMKASTQCFIPVSSSCVAYDY